MNVSSVLWLWTSPFIAFDHQVWPQPAIGAFYYRNIKLRSIKRERHQFIYITRICQTYSPMDTICKLHKSRFMRFCDERMLEDDIPGYSPIRSLNSLFHRHIMYGSRNTARYSSYMESGLNVKTSQHIRKCVLRKCILSILSLVFLCVCCFNPPAIH